MRILGIFSLPYSCYLENYYLFFYDKESYCRKSQPWSKIRLFACLPRMTVYLSIAFE